MDYVWSILYTVLSCRSIKVSLHRATARLCSVWTDNFNFAELNEARLVCCQSRQKIFILCIVVWQSAVDLELKKNNCAAGKLIEILNLYYRTSTKCEHVYQSLPKESSLFPLKESLHFLLAWEPKKILVFFQTPYQWKVWPLQVKRANVLLAHTIIRNCLKNL